MKIGILTFHDAINYGAVLQAYALQTKLTDLGHEVEIINYTCDKLKKNYKNFYVASKSVKSIITAAVYYPIRRVRSKKFRQFKDKYLYLSNSTNVLKCDLQEIQKKYDYVITGSDQVWNPELTGYDKSYFLDFAEEGKRISYAASLGTDSPTKQQEAFYKENLNGYFMKTVREEENAEYLSELLSETVESVCDPVFLLEKNQWKMLFEQKPLEKDPYVFVYCLQEKQAYHYGEELAKIKKLSMVCITQSLKDKVNGKRHFTAGVEAFLNYIYHAEYVITDSFHAAAFALIFNKPLKIVLKSNYKHLNTRLKCLAQKFDVEDCMISCNNAENDWTSEIEYRSVNKLIEKERQKALDILKF